MPPDQPPRLKPATIMIEGEIKWMPWPKGVKEIHGPNYTITRAGPIRNLTMRDMGFRFPFHWRLYFLGRRALIKTLRGLISFSVLMRWPWAVFKLMQVQRALGFRFSR